MGKAVESASHHEWYEHEWERDYLETSTLIVLVCLALAFEICFHRLKHTMKHSYRYGDEHPHEALEVRGGSRQFTEDCTRHKRLFQEFVSRVGAEYMSVGFLGLCVFVFNFMHGFETLVKTFHSTEELHLPGSETEYIHFVELVHMKLFLGMALYFCLVSRVVSGGVRMVHTWERFASHRHCRSTDSADPNFDKFLRLRCYFLLKLSDWQSTEPAHFREACRTLGICALGVGAQQKFDRWLQENLSFSKYLSLNVENGVCDSVEVHPCTWLVLLIIICCFAAVDRFGHLISLIHGTPVCILLACAILASMQCFAIRKHRRVGDRVSASGIDPAQQCAMSFKEARPESGLSGESTEGPTSSDLSESCSLGSERHQVPELAAPRVAAVVPTALHIPVARTLPLNETCQEPGLFSPTASYSNAERIVKRIHRRHNTEMFMLRVLQIVLFLISYVFARTLLDVHDWKYHTERVAICIAGFVLLFLWLAYWLPSEVPMFLALMAVPPFMDDENIKVV